MKGTPTTSIAIILIPSGTSMFACGGISKLKGTLNRGQFAGEVLRPSRAFEA